MKTTWLCAALFAVGCGGSSLTVDEFAKEQVKLQCEFEVRCCKTVARAVVFTDVASCEAATEAHRQMAVADTQAQIAAGTRRFDVGAAEHCNSVVKSLFSSCSNTLEVSDVIACGTVFVGTVAVGGACGSGDADCVGGADCVDGTCKKLLASGAVCASSDSTKYPSCANGLQCDASGSMTCITPKADGAACTHGTECRSYDCNTTCTADGATPVTEACEKMPQP